MKGVNENDEVPALTPKRKRGRPRLDYSHHVGTISPSGLEIKSIEDSESRAQEGPHAVCKCTVCGEPSRPRLRDVLRGHAQSDGCRKRECYLAYLGRAVNRLDESTRADIWIAKYQGQTRHQVAKRFGLQPSVVDAAERDYQAKLTDMINQGIAQEVMRLASKPVPNHSRSGVAVAAEAFGLSEPIIQYLMAVGKKQAKEAEEYALMEAENAEVMADAILKCIAEQKSETAFRADELPKDKLNRSQIGILRGEYKRHYRICLEVNKSILLESQRAKVEDALEVCNTTLENQKKRYDFARNRGISETNEKRRQRESEILETIGFD